MNLKREGGCDVGCSLGCCTLGAKEAAPSRAGVWLRSRHPSPGSDEQTEILKELDFVLPLIIVSHFG